MSASTYSFITDEELIATARAEKLMTIIVKNLPDDQVDQAYDSLCARRRKLMGVT